MAWQINGTPDTLVAPADDLTISDMVAITFNQFMIHTLGSGAIQGDLTLDSNSNTDYAIRRSVNGSTDTTSVNQTFIDISNAFANEVDKFYIVYGINISGEEKLFISFGVNNPVLGAANPPSRNEIVGKMDTTTITAQFFAINLNNDAAGDYDVNSNLSAIGTD